MGIIAWIIFGLIAGIIAKLIMPGRDGGGFFLTCILGIVGAVVGAGWRPCLALAAPSAVLICTASWWRWWALSWCWAYSASCEENKIFIRRIAIQMPLSAFTSERILDTSPEIATFFNKPFTVGIFGIKQVIDRRINAEAMT